MSDEGQYLIFRCADCERCFGGLSAKASSSCPACGSAAAHKLIDRATDDDDLQKRVAQANVPSELRKELGKRIDRMPVYDPGKKDEVSSIKLRSLLEGARDERNLVAIPRLQKALEKEGIKQPSAEELISMAESQGALIRSGDGVWLYLE